MRLAERPGEYFMRKLSGLVVLFAFGGCEALSFERSLFPTEGNARNCVLNPAVCGADQLCDRVRKICVSGNGTCVNTGHCISNSAAFCNAGICVACNALGATLAEGDKRCAEWSQQRGGNQNLCVAGECKECRSNADCKELGKTVCDQTRNACVACTEDNQCPISNICKKDDSSLATNDSKDNIGDCVDPGDVVYVDKTNIACSDTSPDAGTSGKPFCQIKQAILSGKSYVRVLRGIEYDPIAVEQSRRVSIYGPGRTMASLLSARVTTSASLMIQDISVIATAMNPSIVPLIRCDLGAHLTVKRLLLTGRSASQGGIIADQCSRVVVERTKFEKINGNGISIIGGNLHFVVNNAIIQSGTMGFSMKEQFGLHIGLGVKSSVFAFNTITTNFQGVWCEAMDVGITDSIVQDNLAAPQTVGCSNMANVVTMGAMIDTTRGNDPKVLMDTPNVGDKAAANPLVKEDYFGNPRPMGGGYDIGFHEYK